MWRAWHRLMIWAAVLLLLPLAAAAKEPPRVVVSIAPVHSLVANVMYGVGTPTLLIDAGLSPHAFALKPSQAKALARADLVVWVGGALETSLRAAVAALPAQDHVLTLIEAADLERLALRRATTEPSRHVTRGAVADPHLWLDPDNARVIVRLVAARLQAIDPNHAALYAQNAAAAEARLLALHGMIDARLSRVRDIPFVVFHDAYQYLEYRYELTNVGIIRSHPDQGAGARHLRQIARTVEETGVTCVFAEPQLADVSLRVFEHEGAPVIRLLDPLGYGLRPGPGLYERMLRRLANDLARCLGAMIPN